GVLGFFGGLAHVVFRIGPIGCEQKKTAAFSAAGFVEIVCSKLDKSQRPGRLLLQRPDQLRLQGSESARAGD
ncbi:MAG: hypothetical protein ACPGVU_23890, partial [Limisphaerales bacterium]